MLLALVGILAAAPPVGRAFHVTGCEGGKVVVPTVNLWAQPGGAIGPNAPPGNSVVAKIPGTSAASACSGDAVVARESKSIGGRDYVRIEAISTGQAGWITTSFVGKDFDRGACAKLYAGQDAAMKRCRGF
jgi:hypothetical protein